jgi:hypothetical protein
MVWGFWQKIKDIGKKALGAVKKGVRFLDPFVQPIKAAAARALDTVAPGAGIAAERAWDYLARPEGPPQARPAVGKNPFASLNSTRLQPRLKVAGGG